MSDKRKCLRCQKYRDADSFVDLWSRRGTYVGMCEGCFERREQAKTEEGRDRLHRKDCSERERHARAVARRANDKKYGRGADVQA